MFNFLKKKSRVFLIFLVLLLSFSSILNLSVPAFADDPPASTSSTEEANKTAEKACKKAVGVLGWILCPLTISVADSVSNLYSDIKSKFMDVSPDYFGDQLSNVWGTFRNIANTFFIVLFFIVIISQLTGVGIDNYGIKRILPRLVLVAILINLSYIICQLAVDASNIVGHGIAETMARLQGDLNTQELDGTRIPVMLGEAPIYISLSGVSGAGLLIIILLCLVVAFLAIIILWVFCLVRNIGIIVMVALSPLAFACLLLPNTEGFYKKWFSLSKILITIYPICSLAIGTGKMVATLIYDTSGGSWLMQLAAVLSATLPFVAIPYLLLNALSAFGTIGNKVSNWGRGKLNAGWSRTGRIATTPARVAGNVAGAGLKAGALASGLAGAGIAKHTLAAVNSKVSGIKNSATKRKLQQELNNTTDADTRQRIQDQIAQSQAKRDEALAARKEAGKEARGKIKGIATDAAGSAFATLRTGSAERNKARVAEAQRREETAKWAKSGTVSDIMERQAVARQNTEIKEEQARNATLDKGAVLQKLNASAASLQGKASNSAAYRTAEAQTIAAIRDVYEKGGKDDLVSWARKNPSQITPRLMQELSGMSPEFKEFAKNQALPQYEQNPDGSYRLDANGEKIQNANRATDFADFYDSGKLSQALAVNGPAALMSFDKDNWKVLAEVAKNQAAATPGATPTVLSGISAGSLANAFVNANDGKTITAQVQVANSLTDQQRTEIIQQISPEQYTKLSNDMRAALAGASGASPEAQKLAIATAFGSQLEQIEKDNRLRGRMSRSDQLFIDHTQGPLPPPAP